MYVNEMQADGDEERVMKALVEFFSYVHPNVLAQIV